MSLHERLTETMKDAMRAKDSLRLNAIRLIRTAVKNREIEERHELDDQGIIGVLSSLVKQRGVGSGLPGEQPPRPGGEGGGGTGDHPGISADPAQPGGDRGDHRSGGGRNRRHFPEGYGEGDENRHRPNHRPGGRAGGQRVGEGQAVALNRSLVSGRCHLTVCRSLVTNGQ
jgi:hypothetical protein